MIANPFLSTRREWRIRRIRAIRRARIALALAFPLGFAAAFALSRMVIQ